MVVFIWSLINPKDLFTWFLEVTPAILGFIIILLTYNKFRLTNLLYVLILVHAIVLMVGGHFIQGFVPAIVSREILLRKSPLKRSKLLTFIISCICLAVSAVYELVEWGVASVTGTAADAFLGTQGDVWDTQWDMFLALIGATSAMLVIPKIYDSYLK